MIIIVKILNYKLLHFTTDFRRILNYINKKKCYFQRGKSREGAFDLISGVYPPNSFQLGAGMFLKKQGQTFHRSEAFNLNG